MSETLQQNLFENEQESQTSRCYQGGSLASLTALQESVWRLMMSEICGQNLLELFAKLGQNGYWEKTLQGYCQASMDDFSDEYSETWPKWGMMSDGVCIRLAGLEPRIDESEFLLLPTPMASDGIAWTKSKKDDVQTSLYRYESNGHAKRTTHYLAYQGYSANQSAEYYETMMGFPKHWTDLNAWAMQLCRNKYIQFYKLLQKLRLCHESRQRTNKTINHYA